MPSTPAPDREPIDPKETPVESNPPRSSRALIATTWAIVGVPLAYGLYNTVKNTLPLFGG